MDEPDSDPRSYPIPPASVHLAPFSSLTPRFLSIHVTRRTQPLQSSPPLAYLSLQGSLDEDKILSSMQQKLDDLCQQLSVAKDQSGNGSKDSNPDADLQSAIREKFGSENVKFVECGCWLCDQHHHSSHAATQDKSLASMWIDAEPEERILKKQSF